MVVELVDRTLMPAGITGLCRRASRTTRRSPTVASEDHGVSYSIARSRSSMSPSAMYYCVLLGCMQSSSAIHDHIHTYTSRLSQDLTSRASAARLPATYTRLRASSGCRASGATPVAWPRQSRLHCRLCVSYIPAMVCPSISLYISTVRPPSLIIVHHLRQLWYLPACIFIDMCAQARLFVAPGTPVQPHSRYGLGGLTVH